MAITLQGLAQLNKPSLLTGGTTAPKPATTIKAPTISSPTPAAQGVLQKLAVQGIGNKTIPNPVIGAGQPSTIGIKTASPTDNIKTPVNTTTQPQKTKGDPSVLSQQQMLNQKYGAGLAEDGILGPKTKAAQDKYLNQNTAPTTAPIQTTSETPVKETTPNQQSQPDTGLYGKLVNELANRSTQPSKEYTNAQGFYQKALEEYNKSVQNEAGSEAAIQGQAIPLQFQQGRQQVLQSQYAKQQAGLGGLVQGASNALGAANTQQGLMQQLLQQATTSAAPTGNIINVDPITGLPVAGGSLGELAKTAGTVQGIQSGAAASAGAGGQTEAQNTIALGTAPTKANAQSIGDFTNQINTTQKSIATLNNLANQIVPNMGTTGFNPTSSPIGNQTFAQYYTEKNPAAKAGILAGLGELKNQISNVISSATGLTPTGVTAVTDSYDLTTLNPQQLSDFLEYINQYAQSNMKGAQDSIEIISKGGIPNATPNALPDPTANSTGQAIAGTGAVAAKGLLQEILSKAGGIVSGAVGGGLASKILR